MMARTTRKMGCTSHLYPILNLYSNRLGKHQDALDIGYRYVCRGLQTIALKAHAHLLIPGPISQQYAAAATVPLIKSPSLWLPQPVS